jgi:hypothetical protein
MLINICIYLDRRTDIILRRSQSIKIEINISIEHISNIKSITINELTTRTELIHFCSLTHNILTNIMRTLYYA